MAVAVILPKLDLAIPTASRATFNGVHSSINSSAS